MTDPQHVLTWEPGHEGKGFICPDRTVHTWKTHHGNPWHAEMGIDSHPGAVRIMIAPNGRAEVHAADPELRRQLERAVELADPRLRVTG